MPPGPGLIDRSTPILPHTVRIWREGKRRRLRAEEVGCPRRSGAGCRRGGSIVEGGGQTGLRQLAVGRWREETVALWMPRISGRLLAQCPLPRCPRTFQRQPLQSPPIQPPSEGLRETMQPRYATHSISSSSGPLFSRQVSRGRSSENPPSRCTSCLTGQIVLQVTDTKSRRCFRSAVPAAPLVGSIFACLSTCVLVPNLIFCPLSTL